MNDGGGLEPCWNDGSAQRRYQRENISQLVCTLSEHSPKNVNWSSSILWVDSVKSFPHISSAWLLGDEVVFLTIMSFYMLNHPSYSAHLVAKYQYHREVLSRSLLWPGYTATCAVCHRCPGSGCRFSGHVHALLLPKTV